MNSLLEKWAYIMIIIVCSTIMVAFIVYLIMFIFKRRRILFSCCFMKSITENCTVNHQKLAHNCYECKNDIINNKNSNKSKCIEPKPKSRIIDCNHHLSDYSRNKLKDDEESSLSGSSSSTSANEYDSYASTRPSLEINTQNSSGMFVSIMDRLKSAFNVFGNGSELFHDHASDDSKAQIERNNLCKELKVNRGVGEYQSTSTIAKASVINEIDDLNDDFECSNTAGIKQRAIIKKNVTLNEIKSKTKNKNGNMSVSSKKGRYQRNLSLPASPHNVKFKRSRQDSIISNSGRKNSRDDRLNNINSKKSSLNEDYSSDEFNPESNLENLAKYLSSRSSYSSKSTSICTSGSSRKSSCMFPYGDASVVDYYRQKRLSDASASLATTTTNSSSPMLRPFDETRPQRLSITSKLNPFSDTGVKLVTLEQQNRLTSNKDLTSKQKEAQKKLSISSMPSKTNSKPVTSSRSPRSFSIIAVQPTTDSNDKFWVPADVASNMKLEKQRKSLPSTLADAHIHSNVRFTEPDKESINQETAELNSVDMTSQQQQSTSSNNNLSLNRNSSLNSGQLNVNTKRRASMFDPIDPTELQKTMYQAKSNSQHNSSSSDHTADESVGTIEFGIQYLTDSQTLLVDILRVFDVVSADEQSMSANQNSVVTYCKCTLMPDKKSYQTKIVKNSSNPIYEEQFEFDYLDANKLESRYLELSLYELDRFSKDYECLGTTILKLNYSNIETKKIFLKELKPSLNSYQDNYLGDLMFSLAYLPAAERLTIVVMKARNLVGLGTERKHTPDPYVKVNIIGKDGKKLKKKKTSTQKNTFSPVYNEEIVFTHLKKEQLNEISINFTVYHDTLTSREALGMVRISSESRGNDYMQWKEMIEGKKSIAWWHTLQPTNQNGDAQSGANNFHKNRNSLNSSIFRNNSASSSPSGRKHSHSISQSNKSPNNESSNNNNNNGNNNNNNISNLSKSAINFSGLKIKPLSILSNSSTLNKSSTLPDQS